MDPESSAAEGPNTLLGLRSVFSVALALCSTRSTLALRSALASRSTSPARMVAKTGGEKPRGTCQPSDPTRGRLLARRQSARADRSSRGAAC